MCNTHCACVCERTFWLLGFAHRESKLRSKAKMYCMVDVLLCCVSFKKYLIFQDFDWNVIDWITEMFWKIDAYQSWRTFNVRSFLFPKYRHWSVCFSEYCPLSGGFVQAFFNSKHCDVFGARNSYTIKLIFLFLSSLLWKQRYEFTQYFIRWRPNSFWGPYLHPLCNLWLLCFIFLVQRLSSSVTLSSSRSFQRHRSCSQTGPTHPGKKCYSTS